MAEVTAALVKQLREMTDSPMMECKKALVEADGDLEKAVDVLRTMGIAKAVKKAGRETNEGTIGAYVSDDGRSGALVELYCETDFVGTNPKFTGFAANLAQVAAQNGISDAEALKDCDLNGEKVSDALTEMIHVIGENMKIGRIALRTTDNGALNSYIHLGGKLGVLAEFSLANAATATNSDFTTFAHDVAMQVAAAGPVAAVREDVPADVVEHEKQIYIAQAADSGKPAEIQEKMATGRLEKFFKEVVLTEQDFIKDNSKTISAYAAEVSKACSDDIKIVGFDRFVFGDTE